MTIDVSVIVPVYNTGKYIEPGIATFLDQTMPADRREIIFVDDGSTDGTPARLDQLASEHDNVHVIHQPNSGWPGQPRNVGIDAAKGDYVFFNDHDDWFSPESLERMVGTARRTGADIVIGKLAGHGRHVTRDAYVENVDHASIWTAPLMSTLTPNKLFRRQFLNDHGLRFMEGKVRLEDHVFVLEAYFAADDISIIGDYICHHRSAREDLGNAGRLPVERSFYFEFVRKVVDIIEANTEPGPDRDSLLMRHYRVELLSRLSEPGVASHLEPDRTDMFNATRSVAIDRFGTVHDKLPAIQRVRARALLDDRLDLMLDVAERASQVNADVRVDSWTWADDAWVLALDATLAYDDGRPVTVTSADGGWLLDQRLVPDGITFRADSEAEVLDAGPTVTIRSPDSDEAWFLPVDLSARLEPVPGSAKGEHLVRVSGTARLDPATAACGGPLHDGPWTITMRLQLFGLKRSQRLRIGDQVQAPAPTVGSDGRFAVVRRAAGGAEVVQVGAPAKALLRQVSHRGLRNVSLESGELTADVDVSFAPDAPDVRCSLVMLSDGAVIARWPATLGATNDGGRLVASRAGRPNGLVAGSYTLALVARSDKRTNFTAEQAPVVGTAQVGRGGRVSSVTARD